MNDHGWSLNPLKISAEILFEIEETLAEPLFMGVPIGSTLGSTYAIKLYVGNGSWDTKSVWLDRFRYWYHYIRGVRRTPIDTDSELGSGRILFELFADAQRTRDLLIPVLHKIEAGRYNIIGKSVTMTDSLPPGTGFFAPNSFSLNMREWRTEYRRCASIWHKKLKDILRKYKMPMAIFPHLADAMLVQSQIVAGYHSLLNIIHPSAVVTIFDRYNGAASLVLVAKSLGIPTMTMMHGVINPPYGYVPLLADVAFCWGEQHRTQMIELGTDPKHLVVTGCPRITTTLSANIENTRRKLGFPPEKPLAMLATNPIALESKKHLARIFCEAFTGIQEISAAVRLHPSEKMNDYVDLVDAFPKIRFTNNGRLTLDEALAATDILVCHSSGMGSDALLKGRLTVILDVLSEPLGHAQELIEKAGCPRCQNADELASIVERITTDPIFKQALQQQAEQYVSYQFAEFGDEAAANIAAEVQQRALLVTNTQC